MRERVKEKYARAFKLGSSNGMYDFIFIKYTKTVSKLLLNLRVNVC